MFSGGGASYAENELKAGRIGIAPAQRDARPDLTGLSCRWSPIKSQNGVILSLLVTPAPGASPDAFRRVAAEVIRLTEEERRHAHPVPEEGPHFAFRPTALRMEARATRRPSQNMAPHLVGIAVQMFLAIALDRMGRTLGRFDPRRYRAWVTRNSDFRKFDDALRMTVDCSPETVKALEALLAKAEAGGVAVYGLHAQDAALMTCIVPSAFTNDHVHFLDGAGGGYALAAQALKQKLASRNEARAA
jgi:hypothetical protein